MSGQVQDAAAELSYRPQLPQISASFSPSPPFWSGWGRGGDVRAPPRPGSPAQVGFSRSARLPAGCSGGPPSCRGVPRRCDLRASAVSKMKPALSSPPRLGASLSSGFLAVSTGSARQRPRAHTSVASKPGPVAFATPRTAGDALPLLPLKLLARCRLPRFLRVRSLSVSAGLLDDSDFIVLQLLEM